MIAVIADDFAGAAELAGIGFACGLTSEVHTAADIPFAADLVVVDTDSRSCPAAEAAQRVADAVRAVDPYGPAWIFKKVDSVLRGPVLAEVKEMLAVTGKRRAILLPANPSRGRIIRGGQYLVDGRPIDQTAFAADPEHPVRSANVLEMLGASGDADVGVLRPEQDLPKGGIIVGEASTPADVALWARRIEPPILPAGAADFFAALLAAEGFSRDEPRHVQKTAGPVGITEGSLFVCGSAAAWTSHRSEECARCRIPVVLLRPDASPPGSQSPIDAAVAALGQHGVAMVALGRPAGFLSVAPRSLLDHLTEVVAQILQKRRVGRLFVEGGGTASVLVRRMGWTHSRVCHAYAPGVVALQVIAQPPTIVTVKPGSYPWPDEVWRMLARLRSEE